MSSGPPIDRLMERLEARAKAKPRQTTAWGTRLAMRTTPAFLALVHQAARQRDISLGAYIRRCVSAFVAQDLNMPYGEVLELCPYPSPYGKTKPDKDNLYRTGNGQGRIAIPDTGEDFGQWPWSADTIKP